MRFMTHRAPETNPAKDAGKPGVGKFGTRAAPIRSGPNGVSWNEADNTFEFVLATETPCRAWRYNPRMDRYFVVDEVLLMSGIRDVSGLVDRPILNTHRSWDLNDVLGVIIEARVEGSQLVCRGRLDTRDEIKHIRGMVANGILRSMSVGYDIESDDPMMTRGDNELPLVEVTEWQPVEGSIVPIPADSNASIRNGGIPMTAISTRHAPSQRSEKELSEDEKKALAAADEAAKKEEADKEEKARNGVIASLRSAFSAVESFLGGKREAPPAAVVTAPPAQVAPPAAPAGERATIVAGLRSIAVSNQRGKEFDALALDPEIPIRELREMALLSVRTSAAEIAPFSSSPDNSSGERERAELPTAHEFRAERAKRAAGRN